MVNEWIEHVKRFQQQHGCSYKEALKSARDSYHQISSGGSLSGENLKELLKASYDNKIETVGDFKRDNDISSKTSKVYYNGNTGQVVVAHEGTHNAKDWVNNATYALFGQRGYKMTPRFKEAEKVQRNAEKKYGAKNITTIGHSQAGLQSELLGGKSKEIITVNKATVPFQNTKRKNQIDIRSDGDIISALNPFQSKGKNDITIKSRKKLDFLNNHSTDVLNKLKPNTVIGSY
jgi:hypothetical protein